MAKEITKLSGQSEDFNLQKLADSLVRSGASPDMALEIAKQVEDRITPQSSTKSIFKLAKRLLKRQNRVSGMRYSLKKALHGLGPAGFRFEKYFGRVLKSYGYAVKIDQIMEGYCVRHEVDILASMEKEHYIIECKYHSNGGNATDVKTALYVFARFSDIRKACEEKPGRSRVHEGWLVTNTRCTSDAVKYAECAGLKIISWKYPERNSLEKMIEAKRLYPVTILPSATKKALESLFKSDIILAQEIADMDMESFQSRSGLDSDTATALKDEAGQLCPCGE